MLTLRVTSNWAYFRPPTSRNMRDTYTVMPPATAIGFLLSLVGSTDYTDAKGTEITIIQHKGYKPQPVIVSRKIRRNKLPPKSERPRPPKEGWRTVSSTENPIERQQYLVDHEVYLRVEGGAVEEKLREAFRTGWRSVDRFGALSCGESNCIVDSVDLVDNESVETSEFVALKPNPRGRMTLPVRQSYLDLSKTVWGRFEWVPATEIAQ